MVYKLSKLCYNILVNNKESECDKMKTNNQNLNLLNDVLKYIKPECREMMTTEMNRILNDFVNLTDEQIDDLYSTVGSISFVYDDLQKICPTCEIKNVPLQIEITDVITDEMKQHKLISDTDYDSDDDTYVRFLENIVDYCTYDYRDYE